MYGRILHYVQQIAHQIIASGYLSMRFVMTIIPAYPEHQIQHKPHMNRYAISLDVGVFGGWTGIRDLAGINDQPNITSSVNSTQTCCTLPSRPHRYPAFESVPHTSLRATTPRIHSIFHFTQRPHPHSDHPIPLQSTLSTPQIGSPPHLVAVAENLHGEAVHVPGETGHGQPVPLIARGLAALPRRGQRVTAGRLRAQEGERVTTERQSDEAVLRVILLGGIFFKTEMN